MASRERIKRGEDLSEGQSGTLEVGICPNCCAAQTVLVCTSWSWDDGFSLYEEQCPACGAAYQAGEDYDWHRIDRPARWNYTGPTQREPSPHAGLDH